MSSIETPAQPIVTRFAFGAFALSLFTLGCDPQDEPLSDEELLAEEAEDEEDIDALAATPADEDELDEVEPSEEPVSDDALDFDLTAAIDPMVKAWTGVWFSEETAVGQCPVNQLVTGVDCSGSYCDNKMLQCHPSPTTLGSGSWTSWFSDGNTNNFRVCGGTSYVTAMQCDGNYCDNLKLFCSPTGLTPANCVWSGYFSEEDPAFSAPAGTAIKGVQCNGSYCDNLRYQYCTVD